jgi:hypothetical protein
MALSARLNTGQIWKSMKSVTLPEKPDPCTTRSVRLPSAPPRIKPSAIATDVRDRRSDATQIATATTTVATAKTSGALRPSPNAPPEFVV